MIGAGSPVFEQLSDKLETVFKKLRGAGKLTEKNIKAALREVRQVLLEADVHYKVARDFIKAVQEKSLGQEVLQSIEPGQQIAEAFPWESSPRYLIRDQDRIYGSVFQRRVGSLGIKQVVTARRSPWQNPYVERMIGSIRRECLDHVIVFNEAHLIRILTAYFGYYHHSRTHLSLDRNAPIPRTVEPLSQGRIITIPQVGGLHHRYTRAA